MKLKAIVSSTVLEVMSYTLTESIGSASLRMELAPNSPVRYGSHLTVQTWDGSTWESRGTWIVTSVDIANAQAVRVAALPAGKVKSDAALIAPGQAEQVLLQGNLAAVVTDLVNQAQSRGAMQGVAVGFSSTPVGGGSWPDIKLEVSGQQTIESFLSQLTTSNLVHHRWAGHVLELRIPNRGSGLSPATGVLGTSSYEVLEANRIIATNGSSQDRVTVQNSESLSELGRVEKAITVGGADATANLLFAEAELAKAAPKDSRSVTLTSWTFPAPGTRQVISGVAGDHAVVGWVMSGGNREESNTLDLGSESEMLAQRLAQKAKSYDGGLGTMRVPRSKAIPAEGLTIRGYVMPVMGRTAIALGGKVQVSFVQGSGTAVTEPLEVIERFRPAGGESVQVVDGVVRGIVIEPERPSLPFPWMRTWMGSDAQAIPEMPDGITVINERWTRVSMHRVIPNSEIPEGTGILELDPALMPIIPGLAQWGARIDISTSQPDLIDSGAARFWGRLETRDPQLGTVMQEPVLIEQVWDGVTEIGEPAVGFVNTLRFPGISSPGVIRSVHIDLLVPTGAPDYLFRSAFQGRVSRWQIGKEDGGIKWERGAAYRTGDITGPAVMWQAVDPLYRTGESISGDIRLDLPGAGYTVFSGTASPPNLWLTGRIPFRWNGSLLEFQTQVGGGISGTTDEMGGLAFWRGTDWPGWTLEHDLGGLFEEPAVLRLFALPGTNLVLAAFDSPMLSDGSYGGVPLAVPAFPDGWEPASRIEHSLRRLARDEHVICEPENMLWLLWNGVLSQPIYFIYERKAA